MVSKHFMFSSYMFSVSLIIHTQITSSVYYQLFCAAKLGDYPFNYFSGVRGVERYDIIWACEFSGITEKKW